MKKIILGLFIILFCFSIGISELQEEKLSKEEKVKSEFDIKIERYLKLLNRPILEKLSKEELIIEILDLKEFIKLDQLAIKLLEELVGMYEKEKYDFSFLDGIKPLEEKKKEDLSWREKYRMMYPNGEINYLNSLYELHGVGKTDAEKLEEENDRLEGLLEDLRRERSGLEWDMMRYRCDLEFAKPDPLDYQITLNSAMASVMIAPNPFYDSWLYPSCPIYSTKTDRINYEPLLFTLCTDSKGKMDWTKYGWLKLLLKKK